MSAPWALALSGRAKVLWHGAGTLSGLGHENQRTVVQTRRNLSGFGYKSKAKQEHTTAGGILLLLATLSFLASVALIVIAGLVFIVEAPLRQLTGNPGPTPRDRAAEAARNSVYRPRKRSGSRSAAQQIEDAAFDDVAQRTAAFILAWVDLYQGGAGNAIEGMTNAEMLALLADLRTKWLQRASLEYGDLPMAAHQELQTMASTFPTTDVDGMKASVMRMFSLLREHRVCT